MPTQFTTSARKISAGIISDKRVNCLDSPWAILAHFRILLKMDNLGRIECDPDQLKAMIFPRNKEIGADRCEGICRELHDAGLYYLYTINDECYLQALKFGDHQRMVGNMVRDSEMPAPNPKEFLRWVLDVRKDDDYVDIPEDTALTRIVALLYTSMQHVNNTYDTRIKRVCTKRKERKGKEEKGKEVKEIKKGFAHTLASEKGLKPYQITNKDTGEVSDPYVAKDVDEAWVLCSVDHPEWKRKGCLIYEHRG